MSKEASVMRLFPVLFHTSSVCFVSWQYYQKTLLCTGSESDLDKCALWEVICIFFLNCLKIGKSLCLSMHEYIGFKMYLWLLFVLACVGSCVLSCTCGDHRTTLWSWFSVFLWVSGTELRLPALSGKFCPLSRLTWP